MEEALSAVRRSREAAEIYDVSKFVDEERAEFRIAHISIEDNRSFSRETPLLGAIVPNVQMFETGLTLFGECADGRAQKNLVVCADVWMVNDGEDDPTCASTFPCYTCSEEYEGNGEEDPSPLRTPAYERVGSLSLHGVL